MVWNRWKDAGAAHKYLLIETGSSGDLRYQMQRLDKVAAGKQESPASTHYTDFFCLSYSTLHFSPPYPLYFI